MSLCPSPEETREAERESFWHLKPRSWQEIKKQLQEKKGSIFVISYKITDGISARSYVIDRYVLGVVDESGLLFHREPAFIDTGFLGGVESVKNMDDVFSDKKPEPFQVQKKIVDVSFEKEDFEERFRIVIGEVSMREERLNKEYASPDSLLHFRAVQLSEQRLGVYVALASLMKYVQDPRVRQDFETSIHNLRAYHNYWQRVCLKQVAQLSATHALLERYEMSINVLQPPTK